MDVQKDQGTEIYHILGDGKDSQGPCDFPVWQGHAAEASLSAAHLYRPPLILSST